MSMRQLSIDGERMLLDYPLDGQAVAKDSNLHYEELLRLCRIPRNPAS